MVCEWWWRGGGVGCVMWWWLWCVWGGYQIVGVTVLFLKFEKCDISGSGSKLGLG